MLYRSMLICLALTAEPQSAPPKRPDPPAAKGDLGPKLAAIKPNTWLNLGLPWKGGQEVPMVFDQAHRLFFKYGGCGDETPPVNISFPKGSSRHPESGGRYSNSCWVVDMAKGDWVLRKEFDASWPNDRPVNGCSRNYCYDSKRKIIWMFAGSCNGGGGFSQWNICSYDAQTNTFKQANEKNSPGWGGSDHAGSVMTYDPVNDVVIMPRKEVVWVYKPVQNEWEERKTPGGPGTPGAHGSLVYDASVGKIVYPVPGSATWTYDVARNEWKTLETKGESPSWRWRFGLVYDTRNKVVIMVGGSTCTWDDKEKYYNEVWILDTARATWTKMNPPGDLPSGLNSRDNRQCAYDESDNVVLWQPRNGTVWAYRYK